MCINLPEDADKYDKYYLINVKGQEYEKKGLRDKAIKVYEKGIELGTDTPATWNKLFSLYKEKGDAENMERIMEYAYQKESGSKYRQSNYERKQKQLRQVKGKE